MNAQNDTVPKVSSLSELTLEELMNIEVVTASKIGQKLSEAPSTMIVITARQIEERGYEQLEDVLRDIPGVDLIHVHGAIPTVATFRGMYGDENKRILLMIDGSIENNIIGDFELAGPAYSLHNAERIEIMWGPGSALYGANAFSGVINIITKKGTDINGFHVQAGYGSFNTALLNGLFGLKKSNFDFAFSGSLVRSDGPVFANRHPDFSNAYIDNAWSFNGNVGYSYKKTKTTLGFRTYQTPIGTGLFTNTPTTLLALPPPGNDNPGNSGTIPYAIRGERPSLWDSYARTVSVENEFYPTSKFTLSTRFRYRETGLSEKTYSYLTFNGILVQKLRFVHSSYRLAGEASAIYSISEHHAFYAGVHYYSDNLEKGYRGTIPDTRVDTVDNIPVSNINSVLKPREYTVQNNIGVYIQYALNTGFLKKTNLTLGGRYDYNDVYGSTINPRLGLINQPHEKFTWKFLFGSAYRAPTNYELFPSTVGFRVPNPGLGPEKIRTYELNLAYAPVKSLWGQVNLFWNTLTDLIITDVPIEGGKTQNKNIGEATTKGFEIKLDVVPVKSFSAFANFTFQKGSERYMVNDSTKKEFDIPNIAEVKGNVGITVDIANIFTVSIIENLTGARSVPSTNLHGEVEGYYITNLVITTNKFFENRVSASLNIRNVFNQTWYDPGIRVADGNFYGTVHEQPGMNGSFKICMSFY
ncbi:MAG TPA: TonB-dependent receptor [Chitinophagales bacterium]|nr:TonB-dependent receptor [Chitinophagales bacterium]